MIQGGDFVNVSIQPGYLLYAFTAYCKLHISPVWLFFYYKNIYNFHTHFDPCIFIVTYLVQRANKHISV